MAHSPKPFVIISFILLMASCATNTKKLEEKIANLQSENNQLKKEQAVLQVGFFEPFDKYQALVLSEPVTHPDTLIKGYNQLMEDYPKSFWGHEAKKRMKNIKSRKKYWKNNKWELPEEYEIVLVPDEIASCPGC